MGLMQRKNYVEDVQMDEEFMKNKKRSKSCKRNFKIRGAMKDRYNVSVQMGVVASDLSFFSLWGMKRKKTDSLKRKKYIYSFATAAKSH